MMTSKPRILVVTHQFTPHVSPRTTRWSILCEELSSRGYEVHVITGTRQNGNENKDYQVQYLGSDRLGSLIESTRRSSSKSEENIIFKKLFFFIAKRIYRLIYRVFAWPDYSMLWYFSVRMKIKNIPDYDLLISVSLPFTSHLVAYTLNKKRGTRWIMDIGDPFYLKKDAPENNKYLYSYLNKYFENELSKKIHNKDLIESFVDKSELIAEHYENLELSKAMKEIMSCADKANQYVDKMEPWVLIKNEENRELVHEICSTALNLFRMLVIMIEPVTPELSRNSFLFLNEEPTWKDINKPLLCHKI